MSEGAETKWPNRLATRDAYGDALLQLGAERPDVVVLDADLSGSTRTGRFAEKYPERFFNAGIAEQNMINMAAGLAVGGKIPFASTFAIFATGRAWEQIRNTVASGRLPVRIVASHAGLTVGADGSSHQALEDIALMRVIAGMTVVVPKDAPETERVIREVVDWPGPVYVRLGRAKVPVISPKGAEFSVGKGEVLRDGDDVAIVACGVMVAESLLAADRLAAEGIAARVINMATVKPLDDDMLRQAASECGAVVTAEEHNVIGGLGSAVCESIAETQPVPVRRIGVDDVFGQSGDPADLLHAYGLTADAIFEAARDLVKKG